MCQCESLPVEVVGSLINILVQLFQSLLLFLDQRDDFLSAGDLQPALLESSFSLLNLSFFLRQSILDLADLLCHLLGLLLGDQRRRPGRGQHGHQLLVH